MEGSLGAVLLSEALRKLMPQVLKDDVRERILVSALQTFAARGFPGATITAIAENAGLGAATLYRYYPGKAELFDAVVTPELAQEFEQLLERRVRALAKVVLGGVAGPTGDQGEALLQFWIAHRLEVVVLLDRAEGTAYVHFGERFVEQLVSSVLEHVRAAQPGIRVSAARRFVLKRIFENTRRTLAAILEENEDERALRAAIEAFWSYQIPGLRGFVEATLRAR